MKLATLNDGSRDGVLIAASGDLQRGIVAKDIAPTLQRALEDWENCVPRLQELCDALDAGEIPGSFSIDQSKLHSPLPRSYQWCEASVWISHLERCRKSTNREVPPNLYTEIGMYQGGSDSFVPPHSPMRCFDDDWDADLEAGVCVITDDVPMGTTPEEATKHIKLIVLVNDFSLRRLQIPEIAKNLGVLISKPANAYSPFAVTPGSLGDAWTGEMLARPIDVWVRGEKIGCPSAHMDALFTFPQLIAHIARTRDLEAGSIIGAGTVSNRDPATGSACLMEKRAVEILEEGSARTSYLKFGDAIRIECLDANGQSIFGSIKQTLTLP